MYFSTMAWPVPISLYRIYLLPNWFALSRIACWLFCVDALQLNLYPGTNTVAMSSFSIKCPYICYLVATRSIMGCLGVDSSTYNRFSSRSFYSASLHPFFENIPDSAFRMPF